MVLGRKGSLPYIVLQILPLIFVLRKYFFVVDYGNKTKQQQKKFLRVRSVFGIKIADRFLLLQKRCQNVRIKYLK